MHITADELLQTTMNILIVEDNVPMRRMICGLIASVVQQIFECDNGEEAIRLYQKHRPDCVLMDIELREGNGITATERICSADPQARVVIVTNYDDRSLQQAAQSAGAVGYILKDDLYKLPTYLAVEFQHQAK